MSTENQNTEELKSSKLGTKEYWDAYYEQDLLNFQDNKDNLGEIWFGPSSIGRILQWFKKNDIPKDSSVLDVGCGNGYTLLELADESYSDLTGIDYSQQAVDLAEAAAHEKELNIKYMTCDILQDLSDPNKQCLCGKKFDIIHDKGTYDAISLNPDNPHIQRQRYLKNILHLLKEDGRFLITSCNWTEEELLSHFKSGFQLSEKLPTTTFQFGGVQGSKEIALVFRKTS